MCKFFFLVGKLDLDFCGFFFFFGLLIKLLSVISLRTTLPPCFLPCLSAVNRLRAMTCLQAYVFPFPLFCRLLVSGEIMSQM